MIDVRGEVEPVAARPRLDRIGTQGLPKLGDVDLDALPGRRRRPAGPELVDQPVGGDDLVAMQDE